MGFDEKVENKVIDQDKSFSSVDEYYDENLNEPVPEESLHRGLKARQISMIAVSTLSFLWLASYSHIAGWGGGYWADHRFWDSIGARRTSW
jgi:amino acid permease